MWPVPAARRGGVYLLLLGWCFAAFNGLRLFTYLPTIMAIHTSGHSDQHSLLTWLAWLGANVTMALWLHEQHQRRLGCATLVNLGNAAMCLVTALMIASYR